MTTQRLHRYTITCDTYHVNDKLTEEIKKQLDYYLDINGVNLLGDNLVTSIESIDVKYNESRLCFVDNYDYIIVDIDISNIIFKDDFEKNEFRKCILNYIIYYLLLKYNQYVIDQLLPDYINLKEN